VIIPAYNEEETIGDIISTTTQIMENMNLPYEIIVVDDGSTDKTAMIASLYKVTVLSNGQNQGKGYSLRRGFRQAQGDIIVTIDSDGEHHPKEIPDLVNPLLNGADVVSGSRFMGENDQVTSKLNQIGNMLLNTAIMSLTGKRITDTQTGFRAIKKEVLEKLNLESDGYDIETEIIVKSLRNGFVFKELPITCERRKYSLSKLNIITDGLRIFKMVVKSSFSQIEH